MAPCLCALAEVADDPGRARFMASEAWTGAQRCGDRIGEALALEQMARESEALGDFRAAIARHRRALLVRAQVGDPAALANSLEAMAGIATARSAYLVAARLLGAAQSLRDRHGCVRPAPWSREHGRTVESLQQELGEEVFTAEVRQGGELSIQAAVSYAVRQLGRLAAPRPDERH